MRGSLRPRSKLATAFECFWLQNVHVLWSTLTLQAQNSPLPLIYTAHFELLVVIIDRGHGLVARRLDQMIEIVDCLVQCVCCCGLVILSFTTSACTALANLFMMNGVKENGAQTMIVLWVVVMGAGSASQCLTFSSLRLGGRQTIAAVMYSMHVSIAATIFCWNTGTVCPSSWLDALEISITLRSRIFNLVCDLSPSEGLYCVVTCHAEPQTTSLQIITNGKPSIPICVFGIYFLE